MEDKKFVYFTNVRSIKLSNVKECKNPKGNRNYYRLIIINFGKTSYLKIPLFSHIKSGLNLGRYHDNEEYKME